MKKTGLEGITVLDFGNAWAGPLIGRDLGDMGATVIKVESRRHMDVTRLLPPRVPGDDPTSYNNSGYYGYMNRNKLGVSVNASLPEGLELCKKLVAKADIFFENYAFGVMKRLGLGYDEVREVNPRIIYISLTSFGSQGPIKNYVMYGRPQIYLSGLAHTTGYPERAPHPLNISWGDPVAAHHGLFAALAALHYREKTGKGQFIELSQWEGLITVQPENMMDYLLNGRVQVRKGNRDEFMAPHNAYRCQGEMKWVTIAVATDEEWQALCNVMENPAWCGEAMFADGQSRWQNQEELDRHIEAWTINYTNYEVTEMLQRAGVAAFPVLSNKGLVEDPQLNARNFFEEWDHPEIGRQKYDGIMWKMSKTPAAVSSPAPMVGEHNNYVFGELLGLPQEEIDRLTEEKVLF